MRVRSSNTAIAYLYEIRVMNVTEVCDDTLHVSQCLQIFHEALQPSHKLFLKGTIGQKLITQETDAEEIINFMIHVMKCSFCEM